MNKLIAASISLALASCGGGSDTVQTQAVAVLPTPVTTSVPSTTAPAQSDPPPSSPIAGYWTEPEVGSSTALANFIADGSGQFFAVVYQTPDEPSCDMMYSGVINPLIGQGLAAQIPDGRLDYTQPDAPLCGGLPGMDTYSTTITQGEQVTYAQGAAAGSLDVALQSTANSSPVGSWTLQDGSVFVVATDDSVSMQESSTGCSYSGQIQPSDTEGVYSLAITAQGCTSLPWNGVFQEGLISFQGYAFGGTSFTDTQGNPAMKVFE